MPTTQPGGPLGAKAQPLEVYATLSQKPSENVSATTTTEGREAVERPVVTRACTSPELATPNGLRSSSSSIKDFDESFYAQQFVKEETFGLNVQKAWRLALKPESVRHLKHLDRWVRVIAPVAFFFYCVCMFSAVQNWDSSVMSPSSALESCAD